MKTYKIWICGAKEYCNYYIENREEYFGENYSKEKAFLDFLKKTDTLLKKMKHEKYMDYVEVSTLQEYFDLMEICFELTDGDAEIFNCGMGIDFPRVERE